MSQALTEDSSAVSQLPPPDSAQGYVVRVPPLWVLWTFAFAYAVVIALVLQKLVLPIMPQLHAGHGLMNQDAIVFHEIAVTMAERIHASGWSEWRLFPEPGITGNVGILAAIYAVLGPDPAWFVPLNAAFHALGALLIFQLGLMFLPGSRGVLAGLMAALLFLVFPSALVWYGQNHKDAFLIAGYLLALLAFSRALSRVALRQLASDVVLMAVGLALVAIMRPHMVVVYALGFVCFWLGLGVWRLFCPTPKNASAFLHAAVMVTMVVIAAWLVPTKDAERYAVLPPTIFDWHWENSAAVPWHWENSASVPAVVERTLQKASVIRAHFIKSGRAVGAGSIVDGDVAPNNALAMAAYLPRALFVGLFSPFPDTWADRPTLPRVIGAIETLVFYLMASGILILAFRRPSIGLFACLTVSAVVLTVLSYTSPNVGTLHRIRYGPLFVFMLAGAGGWAWLLGKGIGMLGSGTAIDVDDSHAVTSSARPSELASEFSGKTALGAGAVVILISVVSYLGLLVRDLLLINRSGFGASLDSFYLAMMVPMFFVSVLALPLGDALTTAIHRMKDRAGIQSLLGALSGWTLTIFGLLGLLLFFGAEPIFRIFVVSGQIEEAVMLLPIALLLFLFSGAVVTGNSLLNSLGRPALTAAAQLVVPLAAVGAILFAKDDQLMKAATVGMVVGQFANLAILYLIALRHGYRLLPGAFGVLMQMKEMLANYAWLIFAALLSSLIIPINFWFAGQLGAGSVSTWAIGSKLMQLATGFSVVLMTAVLVPYLSKLVAAGLHSRIRNDVYISLIVGGWGGALVALVIFGFAEPIVVAALPAVGEEMRIIQLAGVIKLGALQLPFLISSLLLIKLAAVSEKSIKAVAATFVGLVANVVLNYAWLPVWGLLGLAASWVVSGLLTTLVIMVVTRAQSHLGFAELLGIAATWFVLGAAALAIHFKNPAVALGAIIVFLMVLRGQWMSLGIGRR
jgi:peptidoglycan biosynthesis protein MviN/MurJ (putative lipid II flippase)